MSVIVPAYNCERYLPETIRSVLNQTFSDFELIVVNDGSTDGTSAVVRQFSDPRIQYIEQGNRGATAARNTGIRASKGEYLALLDSDDLWKPEKLETCVKFLDSNPRWGVAYNSRFEIRSSSDRIIGLWCAPKVVSLSDLVLGFPFSPSDIVLRREWAFRVGLFDERYTFYGDDLDFFCRLALAGCKFASVDKALNYRRRYDGRVVRELRTCVKSALQPLHETFADPRCPLDVVACRDMAFVAHYLAWANWAFAQQETAFGQELLLKAVRLDPKILDGKPCRLLNSLISFSIVHQRHDHTGFLRDSLDQMPPELTWLREHYEFAVGRSYLLLGTRNILWDRPAGAADYFDEAARLGAVVDSALVIKVSYDLMNYANAFGFEACEQVLQDLCSCLGDVGFRKEGELIKANYSIDQVFECFGKKRYRAVISNGLRALWNNPRYISNRGLMALLFRSIISVIKLKSLGRPSPES